ncbi:MAG: hypothetical protein MUO76_10370, partial [Anaerolineaceae bacterium]|nr:hypothetical protein [Anaerolineaceae bacterium]
MNVSNDQISQRKLRKQVQRAIRRGLENWQVVHKESLASKTPSHSGISAGSEAEYLNPARVLTSIPRRIVETQPISDFSLPSLQPIPFKTSRIKAVGRLFVWIYMIISFLSGTL